MRTLKGHYVALLVICALTLATRLTWILLVDAHPVSDFKHYFWHARDLVAGLGYQINGHPTAFWPPGYPAFLAAVFKLAGSTVWVAKMTNLALSVIAVCLVYMLGFRMGDRATAWVAGVIFAIYPDFVMLPNLVASENLAIPCLLIVLAMISGWGDPSEWTLLRAGTLGLVLGLSALVRPTFLPFIPFLAVVVLIGWRKLHSLKIVAVMCVVAALVVAPWFIRNASVMGAPVFSTNGGVSLWWGNNLDALGGIPLAGPRPDIASWMTSTEQEMTENEDFSRRAFAFILSDPLHWLALAPAKFESLFGVQQLLGFHKWTLAPNGRTVPRVLSPTETAIMGALSPIQDETETVQRWLWILAVIGLIVGLGRRSPVTPWVVLIAAYWVVFHITLSNGQPRYLAAVNPAVILPAAYLLSELIGATGRGLKAAISGPASTRRRDTARRRAATKERARAHR